MLGGETPSTVPGGFGSGYGHVFNRKQLEEAHRERDMGGRRWYDDDRRWWCMESAAGLVN